MAIMAVSSFSNTGMLMVGALMISAIAAVTCDLTFINESTFFLSIEEVGATKDLGTDPVEPKKVTMFKKTNKATMPDKYVIAQYVEKPGSTLALEKEILAMVNLYDGAAVKIFNAMGKPAGRLAVHVDYPAARPAHAPSPTPISAHAPAASTTAHSPGPAAHGPKHFGAR